MRSGLKSVGVGAHCSRCAAAESLDAGVAIRLVLANFVYILLWNSFAACFASMLFRGSNDDATRFTASVVCDVLAAALFEARNLRASRVWDGGRSKA